MTTHQLPDLARPDAGTTLISEWIVDTPDRQDRACRALLGEWGELSARVRPKAFLQLSCFASADGRVLLECRAVDQRRVPPRLRPRAPGRHGRPHRP